MLCFRIFLVEIVTGDPEPECSEVDETLRAIAMKL